jgi:hypothetical protein
MFPLISIILEEAAIFNNQVKHPIELLLFDKVSHYAFFLAAGLRFRFGLAEGELASSTNPALMNAFAIIPDNS